MKLTQAQREELKRRTHEPGIAPRTRDRLEMVRLADAGWSIPQIARHLGVSEPRVRHWIKRYLAGGFDALPDAPHPGQPSALTPAILQAVREQLRASQQTWSAGQIADWVAEQYGLRRSPKQLRRMLRREQFSYQRTSRSLRHKQDPDKRATKRADLETLQKGEQPGAWTCVTSMRQGLP